MKKGVLLFLLFSVLIGGVFAGTGLPQDTSNIHKRLEHKYLKSSSGPIHRFFRNVVIRDDEKIDGDIVTVKGDVEVVGQVEGDIVIYDGNAYLKNQSVVSGNVTTINGKIFLDNEAQVLGEMRETTSLHYILGNKRRHYHYQHKGDVSPFTYFPGNDGDDILFDYNRVDGLILGASFKPVYSSRRQFSGYGSAAYAFNRNTWLYQVGLEHYFFNPGNKRLVIGVEGHNMSDYNEKWKIDTKTNTLAAILFGEDYFNYYNRRGISVYTNLKLDPVFMQIGYLADKIESLQAGRHLWHFFGNEENMFRSNRMVSLEGLNREIQLKVKLKTTEEEDEIFSPGWEGLLQADVSSEELHSDYSYNRFLGQLKRFQKIGKREMFSVMATVGTSEGTLPDYQQYTLGGVGTIRGLPFNSYSGNRMVLFSAEWITPSEIIPPFDFGDNIYYGFFLDMGKAWYTASENNWNKGFSGLTWDSLQKNAGISLKYNSDHTYFQVDLGWDITGTEKSPIVLLRLSPHF